MINYIKIVLFLGKKMNTGFTMHELSKLVGIPYASFYRYIQHLTKLGSIIVREVGKAKVVSLNLEHPVLKAELTQASFEEMLVYTQKNKMIKKIQQEFETKDIVLLFGSYAKGTQTKRSDIDLLIINKDGKKTIFFSKYETLYNVKINPLFVKKSEFKNMLRSKEENVGKQALKNHIILNNPDKFWECVLNAVR